MSGCSPCSSIRNFFTVCTGTASGGAAGACVAPFAKGVSLIAGIGAGMVSGAASAVCLVKSAPCLYDGKSPNSCIGRVSRAALLVLGATVVAAGVCYGVLELSDQDLNPFDNLKFEGVSMKIPIGAAVIGIGSIATCCAAQCRLCEKERKTESDQEEYLVPVAATGYQAISEQQLESAFEEILRRAEGGGQKE